MGILRFEVHGEPVPKGRARAALRGGRIGHYTPGKTVAYEAMVRRVAMGVMENAGLLVMANIGFSVEIRAWFAPPVSWSAKKRQEALSGVLMHMVKPDADNVAKAVLDGLNGVVWRDDCQVCDLRVSKGYREAAMVEVVVEWL